MLVMSSAFGAPPRTALVPESSLSASTTCVSIVSNVKDAWCERNCNNVDAPNCPEAVCNCGRNVVSASTVTKKGWTKQDFTNITSGASDSDSSFVGAQIPDEALGFYMKAWSCTNGGSEEGNLGIWDCAGPATKKNINVFFSGAGSLERALKTSLDVFPGGGGGACSKGDQGYCERQIKSMMPWSAKTREEAVAKVLDGWLAARCKGCLAKEMKQKAPTKEERDALAHPYPPFTTELGLRQGVQFVALGGANGAGSLSADKLKSIWEGGAEAVKQAGFHGVCFDIESTNGEEDLVEAFEKAFKALKKAGLLVMVTTSHSAPYAASSEKAKDLIVKMWLKSTDIDIFSPQLYTTGTEGSPDFAQTHCSIGAPSEPHTPASGAPLNAAKLFDEDKRAKREKERVEREKERQQRQNDPTGNYATGCTWERLKPMKARWIPSLASDDHYEETKGYFAKLGIKTHGFIQWGSDKSKVPDALPFQW